METLSIDRAAYPSFNEVQLSRIAAIGELVHFDAEEELITHGQKNYPFFAIKSGEVRIVERDGDGERLVAIHGPGNFSGDVDMLTGRSALFVAIANGPVEAYRMCAGRLRRLLSECPTVSEMLLEAFQMRRKLLAELPFVGVRVIGSSSTAGTTRLREFLYKNHVPYTFYEATDEDGREQLSKLDASEFELPVVQCNGHTIGNPSLPKLAECIGINRNVDQELFDLVIVGSGPAGLAAAVYAASEGIKTLVIDSVGPGGQAGSSSKIENFIGFPSGISGSDLAGRGYLQALKFGAQFIAPITVHSIEQHESGEHHLKLCTGQTARARCILVASGVTYRQLDIPGCQRLEGAGVYYAATSVEARVCENSTAIVVGGGNSAGQAAMFMAEKARGVKLLIRGSELSDSMSTYLSKRVLNHPKIEVMPFTEVASINGEQCVESIQILNNKTKSTSSLECAGLFIFIGAKPNTEWLPDEVLLDDKGFVLTGSAFYSSDGSSRSNWPLDRIPCDLETTVPGILAGGDVRSGTTKRCGFAVGDGSLAVSCVHRFLSLT